MQSHTTSADLLTLQFCRDSFVYDTGIAWSSSGKSAGGCVSGIA